MPVSDVGRYALTAPATSSRWAPLELRVVRDALALVWRSEPLTLLLLLLAAAAAAVGSSERPGDAGASAGLLLLLAALLLALPPNAVEPNVLPATASVVASGVKCPKLPVADVSAPVSEKKWIVPVALEAQRIVERSLNARQ